jgi:hypothetical protein
MVRASDRTNLPHRSHEFSSGRAGWHGTGLQSDADPGARGWVCGLPPCDSRGDDAVSISSGVGVYACASERWQPTVYDAYQHVMRFRAAAVRENGRFAVGGLIGRVAPHVSAVLSTPVSTVTHPPEDGSKVCLRSLGLECVSHIVDRPLRPETGPRLLMRPRDACVSAQFSSASGRKPQRRRRRHSAVAV